MSSNRIALINIDCQGDFHDIPGATLSVPGSVKDTERIVELIKRRPPDVIFASQDTHYALDISHPSWWKDATGKNVVHFTLITANDVKNGKYTPVIDPVRSLAYVEALEANGEFQHFIWPEHCISGTPGHNFLPVFADALREWSFRKKKWPFLITKGVNPYTEHFGIFRANVPDPSDPSSNVNFSMFKTLEDHDHVFLAGQARTHCVANSLRQILQIAPQLAPKLVVLEDCMSNVPGLPADFYTMVDGLYADAGKQGVQFARSTDF